MFKKHQFTPLDNIDTNTSDRVQWNLNLPEYAPTDRIGIDVNKIDKLAKVAGFEAVVVIGAAGKTTKYIPLIPSRKAT